MAPSECHGLNCKWDNGTFITSSFNSGGEVASSPLKQGEEHRQAFSKEGGAGNQGGTDNLQSRRNVRHSRGGAGSSPKMLGSGELDVPSKERMIAATGGASNISNLKTRRGGARSSLKMFGNGELEVPESRERSPLKVS